MTTHRISKIRNAIKNKIKEIRWSNVRDGSFQKFFIHKETMGIEIIIKLTEVKNNGKKRKKD
jgi:hypothetical protein